MVTNEERDKWMGDSDEQRHNHHTRDSMGGSIRNAPDVMVRSLLNFKKILNEFSRGAPCTDGNETISNVRRKLRRVES
jgi:hypothetical protein